MRRRACPLQITFFGEQFRTVWFWFQVWFAFCRSALRSPLPLVTTLFVTLDYRSVGWLACVLRSRSFGSRVRWLFTRYGLRSAEYGSFLVVVVRFFLVVLVYVVTRVGLFLGLPVLLVSFGCSPWFYRLLPSTVLRLYTVYHALPLRTMPVVGLVSGSFWTFRFFVCVLITGSITFVLRFGSTFFAGFTFVSRSPRFPVLVALVGSLDVVVAGLRFLPFTLHTRCSPDSPVTRLPPPPLPFCRSVDLFHGYTCSARFRTDAVRFRFSLDAGLPRFATPFDFPGFTVFRVTRLRFYYPRHHVYTPPALRLLPHTTRVSAIPRCAAALSIGFRSFAFVRSFGLTCYHRTLPAGLRYTFAFVPFNRFATFSPAAALLLVQFAVRSFVVLRSLRPWLHCHIRFAVYPLRVLPAVCGLFCGLWTRFDSSVPRGSALPPFVRFLVPYWLRLRSLVRSAVLRLCGLLWFWFYGSTFYVLCGCYFGARTLPRLLLPRCYVHCITCHTPPLPFAILHLLHTATLRVPLLITTLLHSTRYRVYDFMD